MDRGFMPFKDIYLKYDKELQREKSVRLQAVVD